MTETAEPKVGVIGLGIMGGGMARSIQRAGLPLTVFDISAEATDAFRAAGARVAGSAAEVAQHADVVISCLPSIEICLNVAAEVADAGRPVIYIETGTVGTEAIRDIAAACAAQGVQTIDGPISGGGPKAEAGTLTSILAGAPDAVVRARPAIEAYSDRIFYVADAPGPAQTVKLVNNMLSAVGMIAAFEGMVMGTKAGLDPEMMLEIINASTGRNSATADKIPRFVLPRIFGGHVSTGLKDLGLYVAEAEALEVPVWMAPEALGVYEEAVANGFDRETFRIIQYMEKLAGGVEVTGRGTAVAEQAE